MKLSITPLGEEIMLLKIFSGIISVNSETVSFSAGTTLICLEFVVSSLVRVSLLLSNPGGCIKYCNPRLVNVLPLMSEEGLIWLVRKSELSPVQLRPHLRKERTRNRRSPSLKVRLSHLSCQLRDRVGERA